MPGPLPAEQETRSTSTLTIEELTGRAGKQPRRLVLLGSGLPFMGAEWASQLNMKTTWYPGNATEATQQVLVPIDMPSNWEGMWRRTLLGQTPAVFTDETGESSQVVEPHVLRVILEDIHRAGAALRVTWAVSGKVIPGDPSKNAPKSEDVRIVRVGRIQQFATPIDKHTDIRWRATFEWKGRGGTASRVANVEGSGDAVAAANALEASVLAAIDAAENKAFITKNFNTRLSASHVTLGQLEALADAPRKAVETYTRQMQVAVNDFRRAGDIALKVAALPSTIANTVVDFARNTLFAVNDFADRASRTPPEVTSNKQKVSDMLRAWKYTQDVVAVGLTNARTSIDLAESVKRTRYLAGNQGTLSVRETDNTRAGDVLAIHVCKTGDTPISLSKKYYQNPDRGVDILRANRLPWQTASFEPGKILVIPSTSR